MILILIEKWQKKKEDLPSDPPKQTLPVADFEALCDDALDSFLNGNFSRLDRTLDKLDHLKTTNVRNFLTQEERDLLQTEEDDFNDRFRNEAAGSDALMGLDDNMEDEEEHT